MNPVAKTLLLILGTILAVLAVPVVLIVFHAYLNAFFAIVVFVICVGLFVYYSYQELLPEIRRAQIEEDEIIAGFDGDPEKIRFYRGFKKYFYGGLSAEGLKQWFINHPRKH